MQTPYDLVVQLTAPNFPIGDSRVALNDFAEQLGWHISDRLDIPRLTDLATSHLLVEQGLENTAVISFLHKRWEDLGRADQKRILEVSYNNLVDWHIQIQPTEVRFIYNRMDPHQVVERYAIERDRIDQLRREAFEQITGKRYSPNLPALDDAVISTISRWKVNLGGELGADVPSSAFSALFNIIILARAIEDYRRRQVKDHSVVRALPDLIRPPLGSAANLLLREILQKYLAEAVQGQIPAYLWNEDSLRVFDRLDPNTVYALLTDFYRNDYYNYDFSLISQHALSRIYERYVSILQVEESPQLSIPGIPRLPKETRNRAYGTYYAPPYIARFFAHYIREQFPRHMNKRLQVIDPACGSGVFLRTLLELECDPSQDGVTTEAIHAAFNNVTGLDIDENAAHAARLSLALLHLILANQFPEQLAIFSTETLGYYQTHPELHGGFDAVLANPPYVPLPEQPAEIRTLVMEILQESKIGRADLYLAFLRLAVGLLKPGGYGLFVIPHTFLIADSAQSTRAFLAETTWVRCLVDLSTIEVFPDVGTYTILVIFQKKPTSATIEPPATIVKCNDLPSRALADVLENRRVSNKFYTIYDAPQTLFQQERWTILPQVQLQIQDRFAALPTIADYLHVHVGLITGADDIFIIPAERALSLEPALFVPLLPDREMRAYVIMAHPSLCVFYPYVNGHKIEEAELVSR